MLVTTKMDLVNYVQLYVGRLTVLRRGDGGREGLGEKEWRSKGIKEKNKGQSDQIGHKGN